MIIIVGIGWVISTSKFKENAVETTATVVRCEINSNSDDYSVYLNYNVDGKTYENYCKASYRLEKGSKKIIYYDKNNPKHIEEEISFTKGIFMIAFGVLFGVTCLVVVLVTNSNKYGRKKKLVKTGDKIYADFKEVTLNSKFAINGMNPYVILCTGIDNVTGELRTFKSGNIFGSPYPIIEEKNITVFPVYIDKTNRKKYYVSLEEIEK